MDAPTREQRRQNDIAPQTIIRKGTHPAGVRSRGPVVGQLNFEPH